MSTRFLAANSVLVTTQAALVVLPGRGVPAPLARFAGRGWALVLPLSIAVVVAAIAAEPRVAGGLAWLALVAIPPLAVAATAWAIGGARPAGGLLALPLLALAFVDAGGLAADGAAAALSALSCVTLGRLLAGVVPGRWLKGGIVAMALTDAILVFGGRLQGPDAVLNAAVPAPALPQLQYLDLHYASVGYGDVFVAGVLGGVLAAERARRWPVAVLVLGLSCAWDALFLVVNTLPATVPVAFALVVHEGSRYRGRCSGKSRPRGDDDRVRRGEHGEGPRSQRSGTRRTNRKGASMTRSRSLTFLAGAAALLVVAIALAGCGGDSSSNEAAAAAKSTIGPATTIGTAGTGLGNILVDSKGRTVYLFKKDTGAKSTCFGECANDWPPVRATGKPTGGSGATASMLGTTKRSDGKPQVTYNGHPLYLFEGDKAPGDTNGQGITAFGAAWYAVSPAGNQVSGKGTGNGY